MSKVLIIGKGYIGSALEEHLLNLERDEVYTLDKKYTSVMAGNSAGEYETYSKEFYKQFDEIILLAGLSSVQACVNQEETFEKNVVAFQDLLGKLDNQRLIFASSASVYGNSGSQKVKEGHSFEMPRNFYDQSKQMIDMIAHLSGKRFVSCRFGTVLGYSPLPRHELLINSLVKSAMETGIMKVNNKTSFRGVLGMGDLCCAVAAILAKPNAISGFYNMASSSHSIAVYVSMVQMYLKELVDKDVEIEELPDTSTYSFALDTRKFEGTFNFQFKDTIKDMVKGALRNLA